MALLSMTRGTSRVTETAFEQRFNQAPRLMAMGAYIRVDARTAVGHGVTRLSGAMVDATDLRAGASLVIAAVAAEGVTVIQGVEYIDRGYSCLEHKLSAVGVAIRRSCFAGVYDQVVAVPICFDQSQG